MRNYWNLRCEKVLLQKTVVKALTLLVGRLKAVLYRCKEGSDLEQSLFTTYDSRERNIVVNNATTLDDIPDTIVTDLFKF